MSHNLKIAKLHEKAVIPTKRKEDAGYDLFPILPKNGIVINPHATVAIPTGIATVFSSDYVAKVWERGSTAKFGLSVRAGVVDSGYRGEWFVFMTNTTKGAIVITDSKGDAPATIQSYNINKDRNGAIAQFAMVKVEHLEVEEITPEELANYASERGTGMTGSTNKLK